MNKMCIVMICAGTVLLSAGCVSAFRFPSLRLGETPTEAEGDAEPLPTPDESIPAAESPRETDASFDSIPALRPGVALDIQVFVSNAIEIDQKRLVISSEGQIDLPLLRKLEVSGLTIDILTRVLRSRYSEFFIEPYVVVAFSRTGDEEVISPWGYVTVVGCVNQPRRIAIPPSRDLTVSKAILEAGGLAPSAQDKSIRITRRRQNGQTEQISMNLRAVLAGHENAQDIGLQSGDVVFVPESLF
jgi:polysaccharide biosynthesis/export protein